MRCLLAHEGRSPWAFPPGLPLMLRTTYRDVPPAPSYHTPVSYASHADRYGQERHALSTVEHLPHQCPLVLGTLTMRSRVACVVWRAMYVLVRTCCVDDPATLPPFGIAYQIERAA